jgi:hypothetical protein
MRQQRRNSASKKSTLISEPIRSSHQPTAHADDEKGQPDD